MSNNGAQPPVLEFSRSGLAFLATVAALLVAVYLRAATYMVAQWNTDEFSHGYLIPFIAVFLVWQRRRSWQRLPFRGSWAGVAVVLLGLGLDLVGRLAALYVLQHLSMLIVIFGLVWSVAGWQLVRVLAMPLAIMLFMVPLPNMLLNPLSAQLQLISSTLGVWLIRMAGVAVYLQGNVVDLGSYRLEVAEACSGVRYLLPLMTLAFLMASLFRAPLWQRALVFLSSIPITLAMNGLRIAAIGIMVDRWGIGMAEGLLHQVQGWTIFVFSALVLMLEIWLLARLRRERRPWREVFGVELPGPLPASTPRRARGLPLAAQAAAVALLLFAIALIAAPAPVRWPPPRAPLAEFPLQVDEWRGRREALDPAYIDALKFDDYLLGDFARPRAQAVNFYVAWYDSQDAGAATHSPRACLPAGGWRIVDMRQLRLPQVRFGTEPLRVNRAVIESGEQRQLVYYWFLQRGRVVTSEYLVKWYLLVDALLRHRTDGALVRLVIPVPAGTPMADADRELAKFSAAIAARLARYVPG